MPALNGTPFKVIILFNAGSHGWSDTYYAVTSAADPWAAVISESKILASKRRALSVTSTEIAGIRITRLDDSFGRTFVFGNDIPAGPPATGTAELPEKAWLVKMTDTSNTYSRHSWIKGMPVTWNTYTPTAQAAPLPFGAMLPPFTAYRTELESGGITTSVTWAIRALAKEVPPRQIGTLLGVGTTTGGSYFTVTAKGLTVVVGDYIYIQRAKGCGTAGVNGKALVTNIEATADPTINIYSTDRPVRCPGVVLYKAGTGKIFKSVFAYYGIGRVDLERIATKRSGRAFFGTRGRRSSTKC